MPLDQQLNICELFYSIQGESTFTGFPCVFIRLSGCNLDCTFCDSRYAAEEKGSLMSFKEILAFVEQYPTAIVELTGGEPLLQDGVYNLMEELLKKKRTVLLETNGSIHLNKVPEGVIKIMDLKCPDSGMSSHMDLGNFPLLQTKDQIKFVISSHTDYEWAKDQIMTHIIDSEEPADRQHGPQILFSPASGKQHPTQLADWILKDQLPVRLQLQLHPILWPDKQRGF